MRIGDVTSEEFLKAFNAEKPNKLILFTRKYFSLSTNPEDLWLKNTITIVLIALFVLMFILMLCNITGVVINTFAYVYSSIIFSYVILRFFAAGKQNMMALKVSKKLNISIDEYIIYYKKYIG